MDRKTCVETTLLKPNNSALLLTFSVMITGLSVTGILQLPQTADSQQDYDEYLITETNNEQILNQKNIGSGNTVNLNCGTNVVASDSPQQIIMTCQSIPGETPTSAKVFSTTVVSNTVQFVSGGGRETAVVSCPEGTEITGGGHDFNPGGVQATTTIEENEPTETGWRVTVLTVSSTEETTLTVYAVCGSLVEPT